MCTTNVWYTGASDIVFAAEYLMITWQGNRSVGVNILVYITLSTNAIDLQGYRTIVSSLNTLMASLLLRVM